MSGIAPGVERCQCDMSGIAPGVERCQCDMSGIAPGVFDRVQMKVLEIAITKKEMPEVLVI